VSARVGESIQLLGYDLDQQEVAAGDTLRLTLYWQALSEMDTSYTVFNHLLDEESRIWGQRDGIPGGGALPTSSWISGEYVVDEYEIPVQEDTPPGEYVLETGMYDLATMLRLPVLDSEGAVVGDRILLDATPVLARMRGGRKGARAILARAASSVSRSRCCRVDSWSLGHAVCLHGTLGEST
jgi:hypothetical protein